MSLLDDVKDAICEALDRRPSVVGAGTSSLQVDIRFFDDGAVRKVSLQPTIEFQVRGRRPPVEDYSFTNGHEKKGLTSTVES